MSRQPSLFFGPRVQRLFGFHYRTEIYTPAVQRKYGYYVWLGGAAAGSAYCAENI